MNNLKKNKKIVLILICAVFLFLVALITDHFSNNRKNGVGVSDEEPILATKIKEDVNIPLGSNINIIEVASFMGSYVEDGSDEFVENVMSITVENTGTDYIQLAHIILNEKYIFELTTLCPGDKIIVLEKNRSEMKKDMLITSTEINNVAFFDKVPSMHEELLKIAEENGILEIHNISGEAFPGGKVFYKNKIGDKYLGGITYVGTIPELKEGEGVQLGVKHFSKDTSELMFVTYAE